MFEPSVGDSLFKRMAAREPNLEGALSYDGLRFRTPQRRVAAGDRSRREKARRIAARVLIDATELGDVAKELGRAL